MQRSHSRNNSTARPGRRADDASTASAGAARQERPANADDTEHHEPSATAPAAVRSASSPPSVDRPLLGRYTLLELLAHDSLGSHYRASDGDTGNTVSVRLLGDNAQGHTALPESLLRHASALASIDHPGVARVLDAGVQEGQPFWISEWIEGQPLRALLRQHKQLGVEQAIAIGSQVALALDALHQHSLVHGDIRPETIIVGRHGEVKLTDVGLASLLARYGLLPLHAMSDRAAYLTPEQVLGGDPTAESDVYALAAVLYESLAGEPPFSGGGLLGTAAQRLVKEPPSIRQRRSDLDLAVDNALQRALTPNSAERFGSAGELRAALLERELVAMDGATAPGPAQANERLAPPRRSGLLEQFALLAPAAATGAVGVGAFLFFSVGLPALLALFQFTNAPALSGRPLSDAAQIAKAAGLEVTVDRVLPSTDAAKDTVITQVPAPGEHMPRASMVKLIVSLGVQTPDVRGMQVDDARAFLVREGWKVDQVEWSAARDAAPGSVVEQKPAAGDISPQKGLVTLVVAAGNYAEGAAVKASSGEQPQAAVDGQEDTYWQAADVKDQWLEIDLGQPLAVGGLELVPYQEQDGATIHEIWATNQAGEYFPLDTLRGVTRDGQAIRVTVDPAAENIVRIKVYTALSSGTVGWREIRVLR